MASVLSDFKIDNVVRNELFQSSAEWLLEVKTVEKYMVEFGTIHGDCVRYTFGYANLVRYIGWGMDLLQDLSQKELERYVEFEE